MLVGMVDSPEIALEIVAAMRVVGAMIEPESGRERSLDALCGACGRLVPLDGNRRYMPHPVDPDDPLGWCVGSRTAAS